MSVGRTSVCWMPFEPNREELAWAAGFFDGEGSFSWTTPAAFGCAVINQTNRESLERFKRAVAGLGKIYGPYEPRHKDRWSRKPQWAFRAHRREHVQAIAVMLWFKLGPIKRRQAVSVLKRYPNKCRRGHPKNHSLPSCPRCVADAWEEKRRRRASIPAQLEVTIASEGGRARGRPPHPGR
jgi:hypothetical protein